MAESLKLGLVGADASGRGWGPAAQQGKHLADLTVPDRLQARPASPPLGPPGNVARSYQRLADAITSGTSYTPDFDHAVELHRLLDTNGRSSDEGRSIAIDPTADTGRT